MTSRRKIISFIGFQASTMVTAIMKILSVGGLIHEKIKNENFWEKFIIYRTRCIETLSYSLFVWL